MLTNEEIIRELLHKYVSDTISPAEHNELFALIATGKYDVIIEAHIESGILSNNINHFAALSPHRAQDIMHKILSSEKQNLKLIPLNSNRLNSLRWAAAAIFIGIIAITAILFINTNKNKYISLASIIPKGTETRTNNTNSPLRILLEDGSLVILKPKSSIYYLVHFPSDKREVYLDGDAFFEVTKNASRPFFVYNKHIVTRVLGTSFEIKTNEINNETEVNVRTGRVQVYENPQILNDAVSKTRGVILTPNQKGTYVESSRQFEQTLVDIPLPIVVSEPQKIPTTPSEFVFEETPIKLLLDSLEKLYGIEIIVENENIYNCLFTGDISQQNLYSKLDVVCETIKASYETKGTKILIKGNGCTN